MKKVYFCGLSLLVASLGLSQGAVAATTVVVGSCTITGVSGINHDYNSNTVTVTGGTLGSGCTAGNGGGGGGGSTTSYVTVTPASLSYTLGTTLSAPMAINWSSSDAGVSCTVGNASGFVTNPTAANGWTLSTPTTAGSYSFPITCTSTTANITSVVASPSSVSLTVSNAVVQGACDPSQKSDNLYGVVLARQCTGNVTYSGSRFGKAAYSGNVYKLDDLLTDATHPGPFPKYVSGYSLTPSINTGQFIALAFTPGSRGGQMQFTNDPSFGDGGVISISTQPGVFSQGAAICSQNYGAGNSFTVGTVGTGSDCVVAAGQTYYLNFAAVNQFGQNMCFNGTPNNCATTTVSYSELAQAL